MTVYVKATSYNKTILSEYPSAGPYANITGMRKIWGQNSNIVKCGTYIYNVPTEILEKLY